MTNEERIDARIERLEEEIKTLTQNIEANQKKIAERLVNAVIQESPHEYRRATSLRKRIEQERTYLVLFTEELDALKQYKESIN